MVLCVRCGACLSAKAQQCEVHWVGLGWTRASFKFWETAQSLHANIPLMWTYQVFNGLAVTAAAGFHLDRTRVLCRDRSRFAFK